MRAARWLGRRLPQAQKDDGVVLMFVVIFVLIFGMIAAALLEGITVGTRNTNTVRNFDLRSYQTDSGIDYGIQSLRSNTTLCPDSDHPSDITVPSGLSAAASSNPLTIHCQTLTGSANGGQGWAIVATNAVGSKNGGDKRIDGPIWTTDFNLQGGGTFTVNGDVTDKSSDCSDASSITFVAPHSLTCSATATAPTIDEKTVDLAGLSLATKTAVANVFQPVKKVGNCSIFTPGSYTGSVANATFNFSADNYFASGVYYLKNVSLDVSGNVIGGEPPGGETYANTVSPQTTTACSNDTVAGEPNHSNGYGVLFVLDGASEINVSGTALLETFSRRGGNESTEGRQGLSVRTQSTWSRPTDNTALSIGTGSNPELEVHGTIYAPGAVVDIGATASPKAAVFGGVICGTIYVSHASNVSNGTQISVLNGIGYRHILLTATSSGGGGGERDIVAAAVVDVLNDVDRTYVVESRRNGGFSATT